MNIYKWFDVDLDKKELISLVGAGGKTTTMFKLAKELKNMNKRVLVTTTTAIYYPENEDYDKLFTTSDNCFLDIDNKVPRGSITVLGYQISPENKLIGLNKGIIDSIYNKGIYDAILVEADGSKRKSIKAPASHEPVIPNNTTRLIGVIGIDCIGREINDLNVHRPEIFCKLTNSKIGDEITEEMLVDLVRCKYGLFKDRENASYRYLLLNKVEDEERIEAGRRIRGLLLKENNYIEEVIIGSVMKETQYY